MLISHSSSRRSGFTLVELAVVLVIVGLIIGGVLVGRSLIRVAEMRSVMNDVSRIEAAIFGFRQKYSAVPGDMVGAEALWGADSGCPTTASNTTPKTATCNGDGNGRINSMGWPTCATAVTGYYLESFRLWQHLANADMFPGIFTGVNGANAAAHGRAGINIPESSKIGKLGFQIMNFDGASPSGGNAANWFTAEYGYVVQIGLDDDSASCIAPDTPFLSADEAREIDTKFDDGRPGMGAIMTYTTTLMSTCTDGLSAGASTAAYLTASGPQSKDCALIYRPNWFD